MRADILLAWLDAQRRAHCFRGNASWPLVVQATAQIGTFPEWLAGMEPGTGNDLTIDQARSRHHMLPSCKQVVAHFDMLWCTLCKCET